jgi:tetratricopeptide (TPR) repeat protein
VAEGFGLVPLRVRLLQFLGTARCLQGEIGGVETLRESLRLGLEAGIGSETALAYTNLAGLVFEAEGPRPALEIYDEGIEFAERRGLRGFAGWARGEKVWPLFDLGEWDKIVEISRYYEGDGQINVLVETQLADVLALRGSVAEARAIVERRLPRAREIADAQILVPALLVAGEVARFEGRPAAAVELVEELLLETKTRHAYRAGVASELARICLAVVAHEPLARALDDLEARGLIRWVLSVRSAQAVLAEMEGRLDEAHELQRDVAAEWDGRGFVYETAHARFGRGRCLIGIGRHGEAAEHLLGAREAFGRLGAAPLVAEVDGWVTQAAVG